MDDPIDSWDQMGLPAKKEKPVDRWLGLWSVAVGIAFFLLPKTPAVVLCSLVLIAALLVHPVWNFWWIEERLWRRLLASFIFICCLIILGWISWPAFPTPITSIRTSIAQSPAPTSVTKQSQLGPVVARLNPKRISKPQAVKPNTPCFNIAEGTFYDGLENLPSGPDLKKPVFNVDDVYRMASLRQADRVLMFWELAITNRGEESIARDWELCVDRKDKPLLFKAVAVPDVDIDVGKASHFTILSTDSLMEKTALKPVAHASREIGWVAFSVPEEVVTMMANKEAKTTGTIRFKDYRGFVASYAFDYDPNETTDLNQYVPGRKK